MGRIGRGEPDVRRGLNAIAGIGTLLVSGSGYPVQAQLLIPPKPLQQQVKEVATLLEGEMDTVAQAQQNSQAPSVRITTCQIQVTDGANPSGSIFLYQEQALTSNLSKPYRQRFLQITSSPSTQSVRSLSFRPTSTGAFAGLCNKPLPERSVKMSDLGSYVCSVFLKPVGDTYLGNTPINGCPANYRGASRITNRIELTPTGMNTWDRGFDANGNQVWGAKTESYQFRRVDKTRI
jgi:hypothetical protein